MVRFQSEKVSRNFFCTISDQAGTDMTLIRGAATAVTGAASGIGRELAIELAARGADLALADRDEAGLQSAAAQIATSTTRTGATRKVSLHRLDIGDSEAVT